LIPPHDEQGLELMSLHLFPVEERQIEILVHPQSVVHSMVAYNDARCWRSWARGHAHTDSHTLAWRRGCRPGGPP